VKVVHRYLLLDGDFLSARLTTLKKRRQKELRSRLGRGAFMVTGKKTAADPAEIIKQCKRRRDNRARNPAEKKDARSKARGKN